MCERSADNLRLASDARAALALCRALLDAIDTSGPGKARIALDAAVAETERVIIRGEAAAQRQGTLGGTVQEMAKQSVANLAAHLRARYHVAPM